jgi:hypothetical protein
MFFILLVGASALFVAGCAAFFSIKGLVVLFSGSALAIAIMASALEIGKLVAASFLHQYWSEVGILLKTYLCIAVFVLMLITSLGIFGFLTGAYQQHSANVSVFETELRSLETEKVLLESGIADNTARIQTLTQVRVDQETRVKEAGNYKLPREQAYAAIAEANREIAEKERLVAENRDKLVALEKTRAATETKMNTTTDVGSFKFIATTLGTDIDTAVRYFIFALIFVFDPLAVTLVLALNVLLEKRAERRSGAPSKFEVSANATVSSTSHKKKQKVEPPAPDPIEEEKKHIEEDEFLLSTADLYAAGQITKEEYKRRVRAGKNNSVIIS